MKIIDHYLRNAAEAQAEGEKTTTSKERHIWQSIARSWLALAALQPPADDPFEKEASERGTKQDVSTSFQ